ncbi:MAG: AAA family ATPase [Actinomycetota bacterium]|nr:AAA family ATPase [Actinomycetota bacterium]
MIALAVGSIVLIVVIPILVLLVTSRHRRTSSPPDPVPRYSREAPPMNASDPSLAHSDPAALAATSPGHLTRLAPQRSKLRFADVAGLEAAIEELQEVADYLSDPGRYQALGAELPKGILLHGPPGCGKTLLARALAGETGVPFYSVSAASFVEQYVGLGAARVRQLFEAAKTRSPSIIFVDELDAMGRSRNDANGGTAEFDHTLNQLLVELDGFGGSAGVLIVGATNRPELLDPALLRSGRFDRRISVDRPDRDGRERILELHALSRPFSGRIDWARVAAHTVGLAPSELANIVNEAALLAARRHETKIAPQDVEQACVRQLSGSLGSEIIDDNSRWLLSLHEAGHALLSQLLRGVRPPPRVSIVSRSDATDTSAWCAGEAREVLTKRDLLARLVLLLGGRAAELNVLGQPSTQAEDDLAHAAALARQMVERWGMTGRFELASGRRPDHLAYVEGSAGGEEVRRLVAGAEARAQAILGDNQHKLLAIASVLAERETISSDEVAAMAGKAGSPRRLAPLNAGTRPSPSE